MSALQVIGEPIDVIESNSNKKIRILVQMSENGNEIVDKSK